MDISNKAAYLKGLADGLKLGDTDQDKLLKEIVNFLGELSQSVEDCFDKTEILDEYCDELDKDLGEVEEFLCDILEEDECDCDCDDCDDDCDCGCDCGHDHSEELFTYVCPHCNESFFLDEDDFANGEVECPYCEEIVCVGDCEDYVKELDIDDDCGCDCCCDKE